MARVSKDSDYPESYHISGDPDQTAPYFHTTGVDTSRTSESIKLFDVTCVVGSVYSGGTEDPRTVALHMIAEHGVDGEYSFPDVNEGGAVLVHIETTNPK